MQNTYCSGTVEFIPSDSSAAAPAGLCRLLPKKCVLRFKAFAAQPRLAIVTKTLALAANDLTHFGIVS
jgi:hypothetical protein